MKEYTEEDLKKVWNKAQEVANAKNWNYYNGYTKEQPTNYKKEADVTFKEFFNKIIKNEI